MRRRALLAATSATTLGMFAGCLGDSFGVQDNPTADCETTDRDSTVDEDTRMDEPPQEITRPEEPEPEEDDYDWNAEYLGECMVTEPSLSFEVLTRELPTLEDVGLQSREHDYWAGLIRSEADRENVLYMDGAEMTVGKAFLEKKEEVLGRLEAVDYDEAVIVVVETVGGRSTRPRWVRVEEHEEGIHLHGYRPRPYSSTLELGVTRSIMKVERPDSAVSRARVSLTVRDDERVHFDSTEGPVAIDR